MKTINIKSLFAVAIITIVIVSCKQDVITLQQPTTTTPVTPSKGTADFTKFIAIGNSLTAGYQAGALFTDGQNNSFPLILSKQFSVAQGSTLTFNQPDINSVNGYNSTVSGLVLGRYILYAADGNPNDAVPTPAGYPGVPAPYNTAGPAFTDPAFYNITFDKTKLNNFGAPGILLGQCLIGATGGPSTGNPYFNPYYARFASNPGTSTIIGDAIAAQPTFFVFDLGNNDVLGYATTGGNGTVPLTTLANFQTYYSNAIGALLNPATNPNNPKGVVTTIPNVTTIPYFYTVTWNAIPLDATTAAEVNTGFAGYNQILGAIAANAALLTNFGLSAADLNSRMVNFTASKNNPILIADKTLTDLTTVFGYLASIGPANGGITAAQQAALAPYTQVRQATSNDLITLSAGAILGTTVGGNPLLVNGVSVPLGDTYVLLPSETTAILTATAGFNSIINSVAAQYSSQIAVADINSVFTSFVTNQYIVSDGVMITPSFTPPFGAFSEDGVHPNSRGYAYLANVIIDAINAKFTAAVPHASLAAYTGVGLPLVP